MALLTQVLLGLILSGLIGVFAYKRESLTKSGAVGAVITGTAIFGFGGLGWGLLLMVFFVTSTLLSHYKEAEKESLSEKFAKGSQRDIGQVFANGGAGALIALMTLLLPEQLPLLLAAFIGTLATVNADTWATELGVLHKSPPRLISTWQVVEPGTSGGVTLTGFYAKLAGSALIGVAAMGLGWIPFVWMLIPAAILGGLAGSYLDSLFGATVQVIYHCPSCEKETEKHPTHICGTETVYKRGWNWLNNDLVNFISSFFGAAVSVGVWWGLT